MQATKNDPRKTRFGSFLRKSSIDELPQFINVLKGEMSIVGPRPHMLQHTELYSKLVNKYMVRHLIKPGITGWAQVTGIPRRDPRVEPGWRAACAATSGISKTGRCCWIYASCS